MKSHLFYITSFLSSLLVWASVSEAQAPDWQVTPAAFEQSIAVNAVLLKDFAPETDARSRLAAFVGGQLRGVASPQQVLGQWLYFLTVYGSGGETVEFKAYIAAQDTVLDAGETLVFAANATYGEPAAPLQIHVDIAFDFPPIIAAIPGQTIEVGGAFAAIDLNSFLQSSDGDSVVWSASGPDFARPVLDVVVGIDNTVSITPPFASWTGADTLVFTAVEQTTARLAASATAVFAVLPPDSPPQVQPIPNQVIGQAGRFAAIALDEYLSENDGDDVVWSYRFEPSGQVDAKPAWSVAAGNFEQAMSVTARVESRGVAAGMGANLLGAFAGSQLRGVAEPIDVLGAAVYFLTIYGETNGEDIDLRFFDATANELLSIKETLNFTANGQLGSPAAPLVLSAGRLQIEISDEEMVRIDFVDVEWSGSETVVFKATDQGTLNGFADSTSVIFTVLQDHQPLVGAIPDQTVDLGQSFTSFDLDSFLSEVDGDEVQWSFGGNNVLNVNIDAANRVTVAPTVPAWSGSERVIFTATDNTANALSSASEVLFSVRPLDRAPQVGAIPPQAIGLGQTFAPLNLGDYLTELDGDAVVWSYAVAGGNGGDGVPDWSVNPADYELSMSATVAVTSLGAEKGMGSHLLAAFADGELRGVARPTQMGNGALYFVSIYGRTGGEELRWRFYDADADRVLPVTEALSFQANAMLGSPASPLALRAGVLLVEIAGDLVQVSAVDQGVAGSEQIVFVATDQSDRALADSALATFTVLADRAPIVGEILGQTIEAGTAFATFDLDDYLSELDGDGISWGSSGAVQLSVTIGGDNQVSIAPPDPGWTGTETILFTATDNTANELSASSAANFSVRQLDRAPIIAAIPDQSIRQFRNFPALALNDYLTELDGDEIEWHLLLPDAPPQPHPTWVVATSQYEQTMSATATVSVRGATTSAGSHLLAALAYDETQPDGLGAVRGVAGPTLVGDNALYFLSIYGHGNGEDLALRFYDAAREEVLTIGEGLVFVANEQRGSPMAPWALTAGNLAYEIAADNALKTQVLVADWLGSETLRLVVADSATPRALDDTVSVLFSVLPPQTIYGDVNGDEAIDEEDARLIMLHVVGASLLPVVDEAAADVSGDGRISPFDVTLVRQFVRGEIVGFPVGGGGAP